MSHFSIQKTIGPEKTPTKLNLKANIASGSITRVAGISGSGKTTLLKILAGFITPDQALIEFDGIVWQDTSRKIYLPAFKRSCGFVFQDHALFAHMNVAGHLAYAGAALPMQHELLENFDLTNAVHSRPSQLSGGQQQRLSIARALASSPKVLLMDEPFSAQDQTVKTKICAYLATYLKKNGVTAILASHQPLAIESQGLLIASSEIKL